VVLDVVLTDLGGNLVRDLTQDDFVVFEDKRRQTISDFECVELHRMPSGREGRPLVRSSAVLRRIGPAPVTVLVLDELITKFEDMASGRNAAENFLRREPRVLSQPTTLIAPSFTHFLVLRDYT